MSTHTVPRPTAHQDSGRQSLVELTGIRKAFGTGGAVVVAVADVSLTIGAGEFFALLGPSGCGKTTLLRLLAGFEHPDAGTISLAGRSLLNDPPNKRPVNTVFQSYALFPHMSVAENVAFGLRNLGIGGAELKQRVTSALELVRLGAMAARRPTQLSGGQQQRVALARALAPRPRLLLLDEPLSALDPQLRRGLQTELKRIQRETGVTFLLVTHDQEEAFSLADRVAVMEGGRVRQLGTPDEIYERPRSRFVAEFTGANILPGALVGHKVPLVAIRPERVELTRDAAGGQFAARIEDLAYLGGRWSCVLTVDGTQLRAEREELPPGLTPGEVVGCVVPSQSLVVLDPDA